MANGAGTTLNIDVDVSQVNFVIEQYLSNCVTVDEAIDLLAQTKRGVVLAPNMHCG